MYAISKNILFVCALFLGYSLDAVTDDCPCNNLIHHSYVYYAPSDEVLKRPYVVQQYFQNAFSNAQFGLSDSKHGYKDEERRVYLVCYTDKSWIGLVLELDNKRVLLDSCLALVDETRFFIVKKMLDLLLGDNTYIEI